MPYCSRCGVEVDPEIVRCPLCEAPIQQLPLNGGNPWPAKPAPPPLPAPRSTEERIALAKTLTTLGFLIPASIVMSVDWFVSGRLTWSLLVLSCLVAAWLCAILPLVFTRRPYSLIVSLTATAGALEFIIGYLSGNISWVLPGGIPITLLGGVLAGLIVLLARKAERLGSNLASWILLALTVLVTGIDILINLLLTGNWKMGWSLIVTATTLPISVLLLYLHYWPSAQSRMRRYFHV